MKIKSVSVNNRKKVIEIVLSNANELALPFSKLALRPTAQNKITDIFVDKQLAKRAITYVLASKEEASIHLDAFLDYNKDPEFMRLLILHKLTVEAKNLFIESTLSKHEIMRRMSTSASQLYRLLDTTNQRKSVDEMLKLLAVLGCYIELNVIKDAA